MRAIYEFSANSSEETSLEEGQVSPLVECTIVSDSVNSFCTIQIVVMMRSDGDGWLFGKSGESEGLFPENYVEKLCVV